MTGRDTGPALFSPGEFQRHHPVAKFHLIQQHELVGTRMYPMAVGTVPAFELIGMLKVQVLLAVTE